MTEAGETGSLPQSVVLNYSLDTAAILPMAELNLMSDPDFLPRCAGND